MPNASDIAGRDECACCEPAGSWGLLSYERDDGSGMCLVRHNVPALLLCLQPERQAEIVGIARRQCQYQVAWRSDSSGLVLPRTDCGHRLRGHRPSDCTCTLSATGSKFAIERHYKQLWRVKSRNTHALSCVNDCVNRTLYLSLSSYLHIETAGIVNLKTVTLCSEPLFNCRLKDRMMVL